MTKTYSRRKMGFGVQKKAKPMEAIYAAALSLFCIVAYIGILVVDVMMAGETPKVLGGLSFVFYFLAFVSFVFNISQMKTSTDIKDRIICMSISSVSFLIWTFTFILGMVK